MGVPLCAALALAFAAQPVRAETPQEATDRAFDAPEEQALTPKVTPPPEPVDVLPPEPALVIQPNTERFSLLWATPGGVHFSVIGLISGASLGAISSLQTSPTASPARDAFAGAFFGTALTTAFAMAKPMSPDLAYLAVFGELVGVLGTSGVSRLFQLSSMPGPAIAAGATLGAAAVVLPFFDQPNVSANDAMLVLTATSFTFFEMLLLGPLLTLATNASAGLNGVGVDNPMVALPTFSAMALSTLLARNVELSSQRIAALVVSPLLATAVGLMIGTLLYQTSTAGALVGGAIALPISIGVTALVTRDWDLSPEEKAERAFEER